MTEEELRAACKVCRERYPDGDCRWCSNYADVELVQHERRRSQADRYKGLTWDEAKELQAYRKTGLTVERAAELGKADQEGRVVVFPNPLRPLIWGDDAHETILCPTCGRDLMGKYDDCSAGHPRMYQCSYCGESINSYMALTREEAEKALEAENHERPDDQ